MKKILAYIFPAHDRLTNTFSNRWHVDIPLFIGLLLVTLFGFILLYSVSHSLLLVVQQGFHITLAFLVMLLLAQITPATYQRWGVTIYIVGILLLIAVLVGGHIGLGARRWLMLGPIHFQPSEILKVAIPLVTAAYFSKAPLPPRYRDVGVILLFILIPAVLTAKQPDLGTAILLVIAGLSVLFLAGLRLRIVVGFFAVLTIIMPIAWRFLHPYQKERILTFLSPERNPLGAGYHIIQSKIALGSGGLWGEGWMHAAQAQLHFLPEHTTDFIFAVIVEEFGFIGALVLILLYLFVILRALSIAMHAHNTFTRLLAGSLSLTFFASVFINMGMVCGILPVVGLPLPLVSYGGTAMVMMLANIGILMSIQTHGKSFK